MNVTYLKGVFCFGFGCHCLRTDGLIIVTFLLVWLPLPENLWFDYSDFSNGFGCHCLRTDGLIIVSIQLAFVAIA